MVHARTASTPTPGPKRLPPPHLTALPGYARSRLLLDVAVLAAATGAALAGAASTDLFSVSAFWLSLSSVVTIAILAANGAYRTRVTPQILDDLRMVLGSTALAAMIVVFLRVVGADDPDTAPTAVRGWAFAALYLSGGRIGYEWARGRARRHGDGEPTLIVGAGKTGTVIARRLLNVPKLGMRPVAFLDDDPLEVPGRVEIPILATAEGEGLPDAVERLTHELKLDHVILAFSRGNHSEELRVAQLCHDLGIRTVSLVPRLFEGLPDRTRLERLGGLPLIFLEPADPKGWQFRFKYATDKLVAIVMLILLSPLLIAIAIAVAVTLGRPILYRQRRLGFDGRTFDLLKFRTMRPVAEGEAQLDHDPDPAGDVAPGGVEGTDRRTALGRMMRTLSVDELPQLLNVVRGEMSLVGPRPEREEFARNFEVTIHRYPERLRVRSGITGWAQVNGLRGKTSLSDRAEWDNYYIENWSPWLDLTILARTVLVVLRDRVE